MLVLPAVLLPTTTQFAEADDDYGSVSGFDGCFIDSEDWYAYQPADMATNVTVETCSQRCYVDGFPYAGSSTSIACLAFDTKCLVVLAGQCFSQWPNCDLCLPNCYSIAHSRRLLSVASRLLVFGFSGLRSIEIDGVPNVSGCECGCSTVELLSVLASSCSTACTLLQSDETLSTYDYMCPESTDYLAIFKLLVPEPFCEINPICNLATRETCEENMTLIYAIVISALAVVVFGAALFCWIKREMIFGNSSRRR